MTPARKGLLLDLAFATALLLLAAVPLIVLRGSAVLERPGWVRGLLALAAGLCVLWAWIAGRIAGAQAGPAPQATLADERRDWWIAFPVAALLAGVVFVGFYRPLRIHFWGGADEWNNFRSEASYPWSDVWDQGLNRPLGSLAPWLGRTLTPGRIDGFLWLAAGLCWANGLLLFAVLREALPGTRVLPAAAAVLLVINGSDTSRFFVLWATNAYWMPLALLLLAVWLFLRSYRRGSRPLLALSCVVLGSSLLAHEGGYPLALLGPILAWFVRPHRRRLPVWGYAWLGTIVLLAVRFLLYLGHAGAGSYQGGLSAGALRNPGVLLGNLGFHLTYAFNYYRGQFLAVAAHRRPAAAALALVVAVLGLGGWRAAGCPRRRYAWALGPSALAVLLGIAPFLTMPHPFRTQFFAAPGQAALLASALCLAGSLLGRRAGAVFVAACVGLLAVNATREALAGQEQRRAGSPVNFERTVHIFRQIHALSPTLSPDTLVLLVRDEPRSSPLPYNYACLELGRLLLGAPVVQANFDDPPIVPIRPLFHPDSVALRGAEILGYHGKIGYDRLLAFRLAADGSVTLLSRLPAGLLPARNSAARYDPLARARPGPVTELAYLRYPRWARRPRDLFDPADGVVLGQGWGPLECRGGEPARRAEDGAELAVNPLGQNRRVVRLELSTDRPGRLEALDRAGRVVATTSVGGRREVSLALPTDPARVNLFRLRCRGGGTFTAFCPAAGR